MARATGAEGPASNVAISYDRRNGNTGSPSAATSSETPSHLLSAQRALVLGAP